MLISNTCTRSSVLISKALWSACMVMVSGQAAGTPHKRQAHSSSGQQPCRRLTSTIAWRGCPAARHVVGCPPGCCWTHPCRGANVRREVSLAHQRPDARRARAVCRCWLLCSSSASALGHDCTQKDTWIHLLAGTHEYVQAHACMHAFRQAGICRQAGRHACGRAGSSLPEEPWGSTEWAHSHDGQAAHGAPRGGQRACQLV